MRIKEIEARLAAIKQEIKQRGDAMTAAEIDALEQETTQLTEERAGLIAAAEKRNGILDNIAKGAGIVSRSFQQNNGDDNAAPDDPFGTPEYRSAWLKNIRRLPLNDAEKRAFSNASGAGAEVIPTQTANEIISKVKTLAPTAQSTAQTRRPQTRTYGTITTSTTRGRASLLCLIRSSLRSF